ncbi:MAG TPA: hypothetical protein DIS66_04300 [Candidatus Omnitrophica bacterium]|nr:hypothetical protein [Candidatus Omnitrophota bacterium]
MNKVISKIGKMFVVPNLALILTLGSGICFVFSMISPGFLPFIAFVPELVLQGQVWRLLSFIFYPFAMHPIFAFFTYYLFFIMGRSLEQQWGREKFNLFMFLGYFFTIAVSFLTPQNVATNYYIYLAVYLAFAALHPDFELYLFFVVPIKMKWLAWLVVALTVLEFIASPLSARLAILVSALNVLVFFGPGFFRQAKNRVETTRFEIRAVQEEAKPFHLCATCGATEKSHPAAIFRFFSGHEYCSDHLPSAKA